MIIAVNSFKPCVQKNIHILVAGLMWLIVGLMLYTLSIYWLISYNGNYSYVFGITGLTLRIIFNKLFFYKIANKNIERISHFSEKTFLFSFISWKSYLIIFCMAFMGHIVRHSPLPKQHLAIVYICMGTALILSSFKYFRKL